MSEFPTTSLVDLSIQNIRLQSYLSHTNPQDYNIERGLFWEFKNGKAIYTDGGYNCILKGPGQNKFVDTIQEKIEKGKEVELLDVGCGTGRYLIDCKTQWTSRVRCSGITAHLYTRTYQNAPYETTKEALARLNIKIQLGDAQSLDKYYQPNQFDIITAVYVAQYLADPWALVESIHQVLKPDGIAFIHRFFHALTHDIGSGFSLSDSGRRSLFEYFTDNECYEVRNGSDLIYKKNNSKIESPLGYNLTSPASFGGNFRYQLLIDS